MYFYNLSLYFSDVAVRFKDLDCLIFENNSYSFSEVDLFSKKFVKYLLSLNLCKGDVIAIASNKNPETFFLMIAAIRIGIPYVNIDVESPIERNSLILKKCEIKKLFYDAPENSNYLKSLCESIELKNIQEPTLLNIKNCEDLNDYDEQLMEKKSSEIDGNSIAYIMFTSGSTGVPKGVAISHQNLIHFIEWGKKLTNSNKQLNFTNVNPLYFDNSVFDFYVSIFSGSSLTPIKRNMLSKPYDLINYIEKKQCNIWFSVPSLLIYMVTMKAFSKNELPSLNKIIFGGEGYPKSELKKLYDIFQERTELINVYGPTECTCICSAHTINKEDLQELEGLPTLGWLNSNVSYILLDEKGNESASEGELCLIGPNVALGYFNDIDLTHNSFINIYKSIYSMNRMYKTGDIVKIENGCFYFIGRKDNQIKHMGYRIELEEIEKALNAIKYVVQAAVIYRREKIAYGKIICFLQSETHDEDIIRSALSNKLPSYMLPSKFIFMKSLPKNANGKIDRNELKNIL